MLLFGVEIHTCKFFLLRENAKSGLLSSLLNYAEGMVIFVLSYKRIETMIVPCCQIVKYYV